MKESSIHNRIERAQAQRRIEYLGAVYDADVVSCIKRMDSNRAFLSIPEEERRYFQSTLQRVFDHRDNAYFLVRRGPEGSRLQVEPEDFLLLSGYGSTCLLDSSELFDYKKFGFSNVFEFTGTVGAAIGAAVSPRNPGREWTSWTITSNITATRDGDFMIIQKDITDYVTVDPMNNRIPYRPETIRDKRVVIAGHSVEPSFLISVLKYIDQVGIGGRRVLATAVNLIGEEFTSLDLNRSPNTPRYSRLWRTPIPVLGDAYIIKERSLHAVHGGIEGGYGMYIGPRKELVIASSAETNGNRIDTSKAVMFLPGEMDNVLFGLFYQAEQRLGRTSIDELASTFADYAPLIRRA